MGGRGGEIAQTHGKERVVLMQFGKGYAEVYDKIYANKDYRKEVEFLEFIFGYRGMHTIVDIGCGTGRHAELLKERGYEILGVEPSPYMAEIAKNRGINVHVGKVYDLDEFFDIAIAMFNVIGYIGPNRLELVRTLEWVRDHCKIFIFDFWNAHVALNEGLKATARQVGDIIRSAVPSEFTWDNTVKVTITVRAGQKKVIETHKIRFFFIDELYTLLRSVGWKEIDFYRPWEPYPPSENDFVVVCVCE